MIYIFSEIKLKHEYALFDVQYDINKKPFHKS